MAIIIRITTAKAIKIHAQVGKDWSTESGFAGVHSCVLIDVSTIFMYSTPNTLCSFINPVISTCKESILPFKSCQIIWMPTGTYTGILNGIVQFLVDYLPSICAIRTQRINSFISIGIIDYNLQKWWTDWLQIHSHFNEWCWSHCQGVHWLGTRVCIIEIIWEIINGLLSVWRELF